MWSHPSEFFRVNIVDHKINVINLQRVWCRMGPFKKAFNELKPYTWQGDVTEAILLGLDCAAEAGTGSGKTMPFLMPHQYEGLSIH
jgi:hypothetical protein